MSALRISAVTVTPVAFADPPLLNSVGVHEPFALRAVVEVSTDGGLSGLGETYADERHLAALYAAADAIVGADAYHTEQIYRRVQAIAAPDTPIASGLIGDSSATDRVFSPFEVACLDIQGQAAGRPVADLLGGAVRDEVPFSAYLFYKWAAHPGAEPDGWGEALDPGGIVAQARRMVGQYGFTALKLKGGVFPPDQEAEAIRALRRPSPIIRCGWTRTPRGPRTLGRGRPGPGRRAGVPGGPDRGHRRHGPGGAARADAAGHQHVRGGLRPPAPGHPGGRGPGGAVRPPLLGRPAPVPAARRDLRDVRPRPVHALQLAPGDQPGRHGPPGRRHPEPDLRLRHPLAVEDRGRGGGRAVPFTGGALRVPDAPGLGVELDRDALARLHEQYLRCGLRNRDDTGYMRRVVPGYERKQPRW